MNYPYLATAAVLCLLLAAGSLYSIARDAHRMGPPAKPLYPLGGKVCINPGAVVDLDMGGELSSLCRIGFNGQYITDRVHWVRIQGSKPSQWGWEIVVTYRSVGEATRA